MFCSNNLRRGVVCYIVQSIRRGSVHHGQASTHQPPAEKAAGLDGTGDFCAADGGGLLVCGASRCSASSPNPEKFRLWVDGHGLWGRVLYVGMCFLQVVVAIIPGEPLEIAADTPSVRCGDGTVPDRAVSRERRHLRAQCAALARASSRCSFPLEKLHSLRFLQSSPKRTS